MENFFITATKGTLLGYHDLIWTTCIILLLNFFHEGDIDLCLIVAALSEENRETINILPLYKWSKQVTLNNLEQILSEY